MDIFKKWWFWILIVIVLGFLFGIFSRDLVSCTEMACDCSEDGEKICNSCYSNGYLFFTGVINIAKNCPGTEIITCLDNLQINRKIEMDSCSYKFEFFSFFS
jgi:hypothetical protein